MNENKKNYTVFSQYLAGKLMQRGFVLMGIEPKKNDPRGRNVFFFRDSPELQASIEEFQRKRGK